MPIQEIDPKDGVFLEDKVWASKGDKYPPPFDINTGYPSEYGKPVDQGGKAPERGTENYARYQITLMLYQLTIYGGGLTWKDFIPYKKGATITGSNGTPYYAKKDNIKVDPVGDQTGSWSIFEGGLNSELLQIENLSQLNPFLINDIKDGQVFTYSEGLGKLINHTLMLGDLGDVEAGGEVVDGVVPTLSAEDGKFHLIKALHSIAANEGDIFEHDGTEWKAISKEEFIAGLEALIKDELANIKIEVDKNNALTGQIGVMNEKLIAIYAEIANLLTMIRSIKELTIEHNSIDGGGATPAPNSDSLIAAINDLIAQDVIHTDDIEELRNKILEGVTPNPTGDLAADATFLTLNLVYTEAGKPVEIKKFKPMGRGKVSGNTLSAHESDIFWHEWYGESDNPSNYIIFCKDGNYQLGQWLGGAESLVSFLGAGGDITGKISIVHALSDTPNNEFTVQYENGSYSFLKSGKYYYNEQGINFTLDLSYSYVALNSISLSGSGSGGDYDDSQVKKNTSDIADLKNKVDQDTVYDDAEIVAKIAANAEQADNTDKYINETVVPELAKIDPAITRIDALEAKPDVNLVPLENKVTALEGRADQDTIYDDTAIKAEIEELKARPIAPDAVNIVPLENDISDLKNKMVIVENKPDNDTVFDPTSIEAEIEELKARPIAPDAVNIKPLEDKVQALEDRVIPDIGPLQDAITGLEDDIAPLEGRITIVENRVDNDTVFDDAPLKNEVDGLKDRVTAVENRPDNDTIYDDTNIKNSHNGLVEHVRANTVQIYKDEIEFLNSKNEFGFIRNNYFTKRAMVERMSDRAYDAMSNEIIGMSVGFDAKAKLHVTYKEDGKPDEFKSFVPICKSNVVGTSLIPSLQDVFWAEWYNDSDNQGNYVIYRQDGNLVLAQWTGTKASSVQELFDKLTAGGDVSSDISVVHKLNEVADHEYLLAYNSDDQYSLLKSGMFSYKVQGVEFLLEISYTGMASSILGGEVIGYVEPDPIDILKDGNFYLKASFSYLGQSSETEYLEPMGHYYLSQTSSTRLDIVSTRNSVSNPVSDALKDTISWKKKDSVSTTEHDTMIFPYYIPSTQKCYMVAIKGLQTSDISAAIDKGYFTSYDSSDRGLFDESNILFLFEIPLSGTMDETTLKIAYMTQDRKNRVPVSYMDSVIANEFKKDYHDKGKGDTYGVRFTYRNLPSGLVAPIESDAIWI